jgi:tetratricopeptide (TPR) repeat protein
MEKKSTYGLTPEQLGQLLSVASEEADPVDSASTGKSGKAKKPGRAGRTPQIKGYEILGKLGEAGQGQIWRALQLSTSRQVALKVPRVGLISSEKALARFEREVELAAALKHPNIAQIHDSGIHQGIYYYAMDLIEGMQLDEYVKQHNLKIRQIMELMRTVCQAVQHAHQNGVIHRDLKPSNIVVTDEGVPFIVDFGLAKNLLEGAPDMTVSIDGEAAGTPAYMSPEQAAGHIDKLDTRTDVYSLGVILFTLLTGESPHDLSGSRYQVMRRIAEEQVRRPRKICPKIDKELEWLLLKALDNEPDRRYATAGELARDIDNYLRSASLIAGPESTIYHIKKLVRRRRALVTGIAAVLVVFTGGLIASGIFAIGRIRARAEAQAVGRLITNVVIPAANPNINQDMSALFVLDAISKELEEKFEGTPIVEAEIHLQLGTAYWRARQLDRAEEHLKRAIHRREEIPIDKAKPMRRLANVYREQGRLDEAELQCVKALEWYNRFLGAEHEYTLWCMNALALVYKAQHRHQEAESLWFKMLEISRRVFGEDHQTSLLFTGNLAIFLYEEQGRYDEAEQLFLRLLELQPDVVHYGQPEMTIYMQHLATIYAKQGRYKQAESIFLKVLKNRRLRRGETHPRTLETSETLAKLYIDQQLYDKAEPLMLRAVWGRRLTLGDEHPDTLETWNSLIALYEAWNKPEQAEKWRAKLPQTDTLR